MENNENESYEEAYTKFNLTLIYNNTNFTVKVNNNKPIVSIREIAYNIFYPINGKIQLIYRNFGKININTLALQKEWFKLELIIR